MKLALTLQRSFIFASILLSVMLLIFFNVSRSHAAEAASTAIGQVIWTKGGVQAQQTGQSPRALQRRSPLYEHDSVITTKDGSGEISFVDGSVVSLNPDSEFKVDSYKYKKSAPAEDKSVMTLVKGGFRTITGAIPKDNPDAYKINTPVATIGVRGTQYATVLSPTKGLLLKIEKGVIDVTNGAGKIELSKCDHGSGSNNCNEFGVVSSFNIAPSTTSVMPPELANVSPLTPVPAGMMGSPAGAGPAGSSGGAGSIGTDEGSPAAAPKTVSNFCVGLLKDIYDRFNKLFG
jgi:hypothetical protein